MIFAIISSFVDLLWAFLVIVLIIFVFAIVFDNAVADYFDVLDRNNPVQLQDAKDMEFLFGNLIETMISLWSAVSGGNDWMNYGELLRKVPTGDLYFAIFNFTSRSVSLACSMWSLVSSLIQPFVSELATKWCKVIWMIFVKPLKKSKDFSRRLIWTAQEH